MSYRPLLPRLNTNPIPVEPLTSTQEKALQQLRTRIQHGDYTFEPASCTCGAQHGVLIGRRDRYGLDVDTYLCKICGVMWTSPRMTTTSLDRFYNEDYRSIYVGEAKAPTLFFEEQMHQGQRILGFVAPLMKSNIQPTVFDVGCGAGGTLVPFRDSGWNVFGCDIGGDYLESGRAAGLTLEQGDATSLQPYGPTNLLILSHVLEHLPNPLSSIKQLANLLTPDGYLYIELPGIFNIHRSYKDILLFLQNAHLYHFTLTSLCNLMQSAGFRLVKGDEYIHALFQRDTPIRTRLPNNQFIKVMTYLFAVEYLHLSLLQHSSTIGMNLLSSGERAFRRRVSSLRRSE